MVVGETEPTGSPEIDTTFLVNCSVLLGDRTPDRV